MKERNIKLIFLLLLGALLLFHIINNMKYLSNYPMAEGKDSYAHITAFNNFCQIIESGRENPFYIQGKSLLYNLIFVVIDYPPLFYFSAFIFKMLFGGVFLNAAIFTSTLYLVILLASIYYIGGRINAQTGIIAAFICGMYPMVFLPSRHFSLELALCAMGALSVLILLKTEFFRKRNYSVLLGIILGLGMLTKQTFMVYVLGPFLVYCIYSLKSCQMRIRKERIINMLICIGLLLGLSSLFYCNEQIYVSVINRAGFFGAISNDDIFSFEHISYYLRSLRHTVGFFFTVVFFAACFYIKKIDTLFKLMFILWICVPLFVFSLIILKYAEYTIAYLPALALISASAIANIKQNKLKFAVVLIIVCLGVVNYYNLTYAKSAMFYSTYHPKNPRFEIFSYANNETGLKNGQSVQEVISTIGSKNQRVGIFYDDTDFDFPAYLIRSLFAMDKNEAQIVDFSFRSSVFADNINIFDVMIYITRSEQQWTSEKVFRKFILKFNDSFFADIDVSKGFIDELVFQREKFKKVNLICFYTEKTREYPENVYIYKRIN